MQQLKRKFEKEKEEENFLNDLRYVEMFVTAKNEMHNRKILKTIGTFTDEEEEKEKEKKEEYETFMQWKLFFSKIQSELQISKISKIQNTNIPSDNLLGKIIMLNSTKNSGPKLEDIFL